MEKDDPKPRLELIQKAAEADTSDPFSPENLRSSFEAAPVTERVLTDVPCRKPGKSEFFRTHPDPAYQLETRMIEYDKTYFVVAPSMRSYPLMLSEAREFRIYLTTTRKGTLGFWPVRMQGPDDRESRWWSSAHEIAAMAMNTWCRLIADMEQGSYQAVVAKLDLPPPKWSDKSMAELLRLAFKSNYIDTPDHEIVRILDGRA